MIDFDEMERSTGINRINPKSANPTATTPIDPEMTRLRAKCLRPPGGIRDGVGNIAQDARGGGPCEVSMRHRRKRRRGTGALDGEGKKRVPAPGGS